MSGALSKANAKSVRVGVGVIVVKDDALLLGKRKGSHGSETWAPPGGHLEFGETPEECAKRELLEETGITALECALGPWSNDYFQNENKHYITLFVFVKAFSGQPRVLEPGKCAEWRYFPISDLPHPLFLPMESMLRSGRLDLAGSR
ncbi:nucleotide triphosphate diphosphatase NUDT15 [Estrella lausannensis]|uniref:NUDIX family phosphohydrolase n=1 Tax=Estrella lausannensis TaxID=483423 RepID=A0A0H5DU86_9BACT|nr:NUDIX domain-containing protein [Estrella lausannensis]CRX39484.1 NUDIX family phosphohydrolase [Estrella lausannensis]